MDFVSFDPPVLLAHDHAQFVRYEPGSTSPNRREATAPTGPVFYVDASRGSDANPGNAPDQAWKSLAKVNASSLAPGAMVLFKRGETWTGTLAVPSSGMAGRPITFGAYGDGEDPVLKAPDGAKATVTLNNKRDVTFDNLQIVGSEDTGLLLGNGARNVRVVETTVAHNRGSGIVIAGTADNVVIDRSTITGNGGYGVVHYHMNNTNQYILNSEISNNGWRPDGVWSGWNGRIQSGEIAHNRIFNNGINGGEGKSHGLYHDHSQANSTLKIHDNVIHSNMRGAGILAKSSTEIYNNIVYNNSNVGISTGQNQTTSVKYSIYGNEIFNNSGGFMEHLKGSGSITLDMHDNTFYANKGRSAITIADNITQNVRNNTISTVTKANPTA